MTALPSWGDAILAVAGLLVALGTIWRYVLPALKGMWRLAHSIYRLVEDFRETGGFGGLSEQNAGLAVDIQAVKALAERADHELHPNKGTSLRDSVERTETALVVLGDRLTEVAKKADALGERQEVLRQADEDTAADLKRFLEREYTETRDANQHLRASVSELLAIRDEE